jgi:hypothetical protein
MTIPAGIPRRHHGHEAGQRRRDEEGSSGGMAGWREGGAEEREREHGER